MLTVLAIIAIVVLVLFLGTVGTISAVENLTSSVAVTGVVHKPPTVPGGNDITVDIGETSKTKWSYGASGADTVDQILSFIFVATKNATTTLDLSGVLTNAVGDLLSTLTVVKRISFEYLTAAQDATNGTASTGLVTISPGGTNPIITSPLGSSGSYVMHPGDKWVIERHDATGITIAGGTYDTFDFVHSDTSADGHFLIQVWGNK